MYVKMTQTVYTYYAVHIWKKNVLLKFTEPYVWPPTSRTWTWLITLYMRGSAAEHVSHFNFQPGRSQRQSAHLLGESWLTDHGQIWSLAWQTVGCGFTEWWTHWTVVLTIWFICCHSLVRTCILRTFVRFAIVYPDSQNKEGRNRQDLIEVFKICKGLSRIRSE